MTKISREMIFEVESILINQLLIWELKDKPNDRTMALGYIQGLNDFANELIEKLEL